ncbi:hypothetical protein AX16_006010 [Volvariella volvacea WC 439]|nr:hypothetical protein AX16_006010 [Volvariella volvacea WC 439]
MSRSATYVKYEENTPYFAYGGGQWGYSVDERWSGKGQTWPEFAAQPTRLLGNMTFTFYGTAVSFIGNTPPIQSSQTVTVSIDGGESYNTSYSDPRPQSYRQWYQSPTLSDGEHTISLENIDLTGVDYALVTAGESTSLQTGDSLVMVDDDDTNQFTFVGDWARDLNLFSGPLNGRPFGNATHRARTVGDQMRFRFAGTTVSLYGIFDWTRDGNITANYTIDATSSTEITYTSSASASTAAFIQQPNFLLFQSNALTPGEHTLVVTITDIFNQTLIIDYAAYRPSFSRLSDMPVWAPFGSPTQTAVEAPSNGESSNDHKSNGPPIGAIVGGVIGGLSLIIIGLLVWWFSRRRRLDTERGLSSESGRLRAPMPFITGTYSMMIEREPVPKPGTKAYEARGGYDWSGPSQVDMLGAQSHHTHSSPAVGTSSLSQASGSRLTAAPSVDRRALSARQAELRRQMQELEDRIQQWDRYSPGSESILMTSPRDREAEILRLRQQIEELRRENLMLAAPPAYDEDAIMEAGGSSSGSASPQVRQR